MSYTPTNQLDPKNIIRHEIVKEKDDYKYQVEHTFGKPDSRFTFKVKGDNHEQVMKDLQDMKGKIV